MTFRIESPNGVPEVHGTDPLVHLCIGSDTAVVIDKLYGPWSCNAIRVRLDYEPGEWVVERLQEDDASEDTWVEMTRFDANVKAAQVKP